MFDDVIVGLSDDDAALDAFALAKTLVSAGGELTVVRVERGDETPRDSAQREALASFDGAPLVVVTAASAAAGLRDVVLQRRADLLVVGASGRDRVHRILGRDTTAALVGEPPCTVAVAPQGYAGGARALRVIGLGYDGSVASAEALATTRILAAEHDAKVSAFAAVRPSLFVSDPFDSRTEIDKRVAEARERIAALGEVEPHAEYGSPTEELRRYGGSVDLLVLGAHDDWHTDDLPHTTLAQRLAYDAPCPLLVLGRQITQPT